MAGEYSDASSSYWAPGWNFERWVRADEEDLATLPEDELVKIQDGLRDILGDAGMSKLSRYMFDLEQQQEEQQQEDNKKRTLEGDFKGPPTSSSAENNQTPAFLPPNWLRIWRKHFNGQQWGFVVFRAACYGGSDDDEQRWARFKEQVQRIVELPFERAISQAKEEGAIIPDDFDKARAKFTIQWEEFPAGQESTSAIPSSELFRSEYAALKPILNSGLSWDVFLCASTEAVESFEKEVSNTDEMSSLWRPRAPFLLAVAADKDAGLEPDHEERIWLKPVFKVAAEALVESLIDVVDMGTPLQRVTRNVRGANELDEATEHQDQEEPNQEAERLDEIWWSMHPSPERLRKKRRKTQS
ncbi:hypothetical protein INS49_015866 [Diaporthe citri]|uniref:uncharacterized protein n=1 Tax=Diaporthe citri TaxID=83186 RepID=UPI001C7F127B|nr:uncharacterized protein INS49_015866 [Diaporthe citri]KAG6356478.1 hypothetical protein INS49_015866 [Diaporthe citri]